MNVLRSKTPLLVVVALGVVCLTALGLLKRHPAPPDEPTAAQRGEAVGLYRVYKGGMLGFIDNTGRLVIPPRFYSAYEFRRGLARVVTAEGTGYIDPTGRYVWPPSK